MFILHIDACTHLCTACSVHVMLTVQLSKADHIGLANLCGNSPMEETDSPCLNSHWPPIVLYPGGETMWNLPCLHWRGSWRYYAGLVQATILLSIYGCVSLSCLGNTSIRRHPGPLLLPVFPLFLQWFPWTLGRVLCCRCILWDWVPQLRSLCVLTTSVPL